MKNRISFLIHKSTNLVAWILKPFVKQELLNRWKPIHLCWWFIKNGLPIPKFFIGKAVFTPVQSKFRFYEDGTESGSSPIAAENTNITRDADSADSNLHLRFLIQETGGAAGATTDDWQLQYSLNGGAYTPITTSSAVVKGFDSASLTDANVTTNRATNGITDGTGSFVDGEISEDGLIDDRQLTASNFTEMLYSLTLVSADLVYGDSINFRTLINGATMTYTVTPNIIIASGTATYYFDGSDVSVSDPGGVWTDDAFAQDGIVTNEAVTATPGTKSSNYLEIQGTNAPASGNNIARVDTRLGNNGTGNYGPYVTVTAPGGAWDWTKLGALETRVWLSSGTPDRTRSEIYANGDAGGTSLSGVGTPFVLNNPGRIGIVELLVYLGAASGATVVSDIIGTGIIPFSR